MPANRITKKRGRPTKKTAADGLEELSTSHLTHDEVEGTTTKKKMTSKVRKEQADAGVSNAPELQDDGLGTAETAPSAAPDNGVKKRKKRKSIGQRSTSGAKAAKARSPLKPARQPRKKMPKPHLAEATDAADLEGPLAKELQKEPLFDAVPSNGGEPAHSPDVAGVLDSGIENVESGAEKPQGDIAQKAKKRKRVPEEELPKKRVKASPAKRAIKAPKTPKKMLPAEDPLDAAQSMEKHGELEAGILGDVNEEQEAASGVAEPRKEKPRKRKRVNVGQHSKKRSKARITQTRREPEAQEQTSSAEHVDEVTQSVGNPPEVEVGSMGHVAEEQEATAEEVERHEQKPKRRKRKSIGQQKPKKKSMDLATPKKTPKKTAASSPMATRDELNYKPPAKRGRPRAKQPSGKVIEEPQAENLEQAHGEASEPGFKNKPKARRGRPKAKQSSENFVDEADEEAWRHPPEEQGEVQGPVLPEKKKRGRPRKADGAQPTSQTTRPTKASVPRKPRVKPAATTAPKTRAPPKNSVPITFYAPPSPASSDAEDDPLSTSLPATTTNTINAVDVLSQLCSELLSNSSATLAEQARSEPSPSKQTELKRTKHTTDLYARGLSSRLLQLTTTLNANTSLHARVRAAAKEERSLKKELKQLEKEREELRSRKEEVLKERKKRELEELLSGIAGAVKRGWDMQKEGEEGDAVAGMVEERELEL